MFIRVKTIKNARYAYLVRNEWTAQGPRQKVHKYLGRLVTSTKIHTLDAPELTGSLATCLKTLVSRELQQHGFSKEEHVHTLNSVRCNIEQHTCMIGDKPAVLALNNGHLCDVTLKNLLGFQPVDADIPEEVNGKALAFALIKAGIQVSDEVFVQLVDVAVKELGPRPAE